MTQYRARNAVVVSLNHLAKGLDLGNGHQTVYVPDQDCLTMQLQGRLHLWCLLLLLMLLLWGMLGLPLLLELRKLELMTS